MLAPTISRWESAPCLREVIRMTYAMVDIYGASYAHPPAGVTLDTVSYTHLTLPTILRV